MFPFIHHGVQHRTDVLDGAGGEFVVIVPVPAGGTGEHDEVPIAASRPTLGGVVMGGAEVVPDLVSQGELGDLGRDPSVVVDEGDDAGVEASLGSVVDPVNILRVGFVLLTDAATCPRGRGNPCQA